MMKLIPHQIAGDPDFPYRTEDIRFSPSGKRLAVVATDGCLLLFRVDLATRPIEVQFEVELRSPELLVPHGVEFLDEEMVLVANRNAGLVFFRLPLAANWQGATTITPFYKAESDWFGATGVTRMLRERALFCGPGSVRLLGRVFYVTCNYKNTVSTFALRQKNGELALEEGEVLAHDGLEVVDGVAISKDGRWMALSDHDHHRVAVYRRTSPASGDPERPVFELACSLRDPDMHYAHGLCFDDSTQRLYVADAGGRFLHVFVSLDGWRCDTEVSFYKTTGVDQEAFDKSQQAVIAAHRMLEGGAKGLDIAPGGKVVAITCRNQVMRFFDISSDEALISQPVPPEPPVQPLPPGAEPIAPSATLATPAPLAPPVPVPPLAGIALSCVVDDTPGIWRSIVPWLASATALAGVVPANIHVHHACPLPDWLVRLCRELGVPTHPARAFSASNRYANKIVQCGTDFGPVDSVVLSDVDVVFAAPPPLHQLQGLVAGKPVDKPNPPLDLLQNVFAKAGVPILGIASSAFVQNGQPVGFETLIGNFNGGLYCLPAASLKAFGEHWTIWAHWLHDNAALLERWHLHADQIAFCLALSELKLPLRILDHHWNFPTHLGQLPLFAPPWILHHHARFDEAGQLLPVADPLAQAAIERINATIHDFRQRYAV